MTCRQSFPTYCGLVRRTNFFFGLKGAHTSVTDKIFKYFFHHCILGGENIFKYIFTPVYWGENKYLNIFLLPFIGERKNI